MNILYGLSYSIFALVFLTYVGNVACRLLFKTILQDKKDKASEKEGEQRAGRVIGNLERTILAIGISAHSWEILAAVIALKSVARFKELDQKEFAEYFLVGSLFSVFWAVLVTNSWLAYDQIYGVNIQERFTSLYENSTDTPLNCASVNIELQFPQVQGVCKDLGDCSARFNVCSSPEDEAGTIQSNP